MKNIKLRIVNKVPLPYLGESDEDWILSYFLGDSEGYFNLFESKMNEASINDELPVEYFTNSVSLEIYPEKTILEHLYPEDEDNSPKVEISNKELKFLMKKWEEILSESRE